MINLRHVEAFAAIIEFGTFSAAAKALSTTQPAISLRIRELEQELGVKLFETASRRTALTVKGQYFVHHAQAMLALARHVKEDMGGQHAISGRIRLGAVETVAVTWLSNFIQAANERYPQVILQLNIALTADLWTMFRSGDVDMVLIPGPITENHVRCVDLGHVPLSWVASPHLKLPEQPLSQEQLVGYPMVSLSSASIIYQLMERWFGENNHQPNWVNHCGSLNVVSSLTAAGIGVSVLPSQMLTDLSPGHLVEFTVTPRFPDLHFFAVYRETFHSPLFTAIAQVAHECSTFALHERPQ